MKYYYAFKSYLYYSKLFPCRLNICQIRKPNDKLLLPWLYFLNTIIYFQLETINFFCRIVMTFVKINKVKIIRQ